MTSCWSFIVAMTTLLHNLTPSHANRDKPTCSYNFSYIDGSRGNFSSPGFPGFYPSLFRCQYFFDASENGGVEIKFYAFELEDEKEGDGSCSYDFLDVYTVDTEGHETFLNKFCGTKIPRTITSPQSKLKMVFVTDHWMNSASGFFGSYRFLPDDHQPFDHSGDVCGYGKLSGKAGFVYSPHYPKPFPGRVNCSWVITVKEGYQILLNVLELDLGPEKSCDNSQLLLYNGLTTSMSIQEHKWCGQASTYSPLELQYLSNTNKTIVRFTSGPRNMGQHRGFKIMWTALRVPRDPETSRLSATAPCNGFQCEGGKYCHDYECTPLPRYCIAKSLVCDGYRNCGRLDDSDERKCKGQQGRREILIMAACIAVPGLVFIMMVVLIAYCYKSRHVRKSASQDQPLANSQSHGTTSRESRASRESRESLGSNHRQMMLQTSFIDGGTRNSSQHDLTNDCNDIDQETTRGLFSDGASNSLRTHKKRPSYHMMQQNYEDGNLIIAQV